MKQRRCIGCGEIKNSDDMVKLTKDFKTNEIIINPNKFHFGRSAYLCKNKDCISNALKKDRLSKNLKKYINDEEKENLKTVLNHIIVVKH